MAAVPDVDAILTGVVAALRGTPGLLGLTLGGSRATGQATASSDLDLGLYYDGTQRPDFDDLLGRTRAMVGAGPVRGWGEYGQWGPWVDGGIWAEVDGLAVDLLLRDQSRVEAEVELALTGQTRIDYQVGHPHGFAAHQYVGELMVARVLHDPAGRLTAARARIGPTLPAALRSAIVGQYGFEAGFSHELAVKGLRRADRVYAVGCAFRAIACLNQVLFAINGEYLINEKGATARAASFEVAPRHHEQRCTTLIAQLTGEWPEVGLVQLRELITEVELLAADQG